MYDSRDGCNAIIRTQDNALVVGCYNTRIPESVKIIGINSFADCANLKSITIPKSLQSISYNAFGGGI